MYIWILLATIMVALSFFNLSPRADKESVFTETKAASLVNRFRIEHSAFSRVAECKMVNSISQTQTMIVFPENEQDAYVWANKALPIGYTPANDLLTNSYHYIFCLNSELTDSVSPEIAETCVQSNPNTGADVIFRYSISIAKIPERWYLKEEINSEVDAELATRDVLPVLSNAMAKLFVKGSVLGILSCNDDGECNFKGSNIYEKQKNSNAGRLTRLSFKKGEGEKDFYTSLFAQDGFKASCVGTCFFAVNKLSDKDVDSHCATLYNGEYKIPTEVEEDEDTSSEVEDVSNN